MIAHLLTLEGHSDGIRFGDIKFSDGAFRHLTFDMLAGTVRLNGSMEFVFASDPDPDWRRNAEALTVIRRALATRQPEVTQ